MSGDRVTAARREQVLHEAASGLIAATNRAEIVRVARRAAADLLERPDVAVRLAFGGEPREGEQLLPLVAPGGAALAVSTSTAADEAAAGSLRALADQVALALGRVPAERPPLGERIRDLLGGAPEIVLVVDGSGHIVKDNLSSGGDSQAATGRSFMTLVHPEDAASAANALHELLSAGADAAVRRRWRMKDAAGGWQTIDGVLLHLFADEGVCGIVLAGRAAEVAAAVPPAKPAPAPARTPAGPRATAGTTVLVVDDHESNRRLVRRILEHAGYAAVEAADAAEALARWGDPDVEAHVVLTDVVLPGMSGRDLADELRATGASVPIIYMSGFGAAVGRYGVEEILEKPFTADRLAAVIESAQR